MKILFITSIFPPDIGGPSGYVYNLSNYLSSKGNQVGVITYGKKNNGKKNNFNIWYINKKLFLPIRVFLMTIFIIYRGRNFNIFYSNGGFSSNIPTIIAGWFLKKKIGIKITGDYVWEQLSNLDWVKDDIDAFQVKKYNFIVSFLKFVQSWIVKNANFIIVPSLYLRNMVINWGADEQRVHLVYNAIADNNITINKQCDNNKIILSVGRMVPWKGFGSLIEVFSDLYCDFPDFKLVIIGDGPLMLYLKSLAMKGPAKDSVIFTGSLDKEKVNEWYRQASYLVLFSGYEGLSHVLLEALSFGLPVIASNRGGNIELINNGVNGVLVDWPSKTGLKNALLSFLENTSNFISNPGLINKNKFSWDFMVDDTISILKSFE